MVRNVAYWPHSRHQRLVYAVMHNTASFDAVVVATRNDAQMLRQQSRWRAASQRLCLCPPTRTVFLNGIIGVVESATSPPDKHSFHTREERSDRMRKLSAREVALK